MAKMREENSRYERELRAAGERREQLEKRVSELQQKAMPLEDQGRTRSPSAERQLQGLVEQQKAHIERLEQAYRQKSDDVRSLAATNTKLESTLGEREAQAGDLERALSIATAATACGGRQRVEDLEDRLSLQSQQLLQGQAEWAAERARSTAQMDLLVREAQSLRQDKVQLQARVAEKQQQLSEALRNAKSAAEALSQVATAKQQLEQSYEELRSHFVQQRSMLEGIYNGQCAGSNPEAPSTPTSTRIEAFLDHQLRPALPDTRISLGATDRSPEELTMALGESELRCEQLKIELRNQQETIEELEKSLGRSSLLGISDYDISEDIDEKSRSLRMGSKLVLLQKQNAELSRKHESLGNELKAMQRHAKPTKSKTASSIDQENLKHSSTKSTRKLH